MSNINPIFKTLLAPFTPEPETWECLTCGTQFPVNEFPVTRCGICQEPTCSECAHPHKEVNLQEFLERCYAVYIAKTPTELIQFRAK